MTKTIGINGMMCAHCEARVKKALEEIEGVISAKTSHEMNNAILELAEDVPAPMEAIRQAIEASGYEYVG